MPVFRLTQISDPHLARRLPTLTENFHRVSEYIDATRPNLVINTGDLAFDTQASPDDPPTVALVGRVVPIKDIRTYLQAIEILRDLHALTGGSEYVFPSLLSATRPMSNNTVNTALRRLGYSKEQMTGHGFRAMASTLLNEQGFPPDVIELQLAHVERNKVRAAYNRAQRLAERRQMMQIWAEYLCKLRDGRGAAN